MTAREHDSVRVSVFVRVAPAAAFAVFTEEIDRWWRRGPAYRIAGRSPGAMHLETRLGGRIFEAYDEGRLHEVGSVVAWQPPEHFAFTWRLIPRGASPPAPPAEPAGSPPPISLRSNTFTRVETTRVDVRFAPRNGGTEVTLEHSGWSAIPDDHPVRHGRTGSAFLGNLGQWWAGLLTSLRELAPDAGGSEPGS
jgi:activator of Hsp90 ATPase-like protein